jgi:uncharacterized membrane protein YbhN (UPF0104 family)
MSRAAMPADVPQLLRENRRLASFLGAAAVSGAIIALLLTFMPWAETARLWRSLSPLAIVAPALALMVSYGVAGFRLQTMAPSGTSLPLVDAVAVSLWHGLAMIVLPARLGELALIEAIRRYAGIGRGTGLAILLLQRIYDLILTSLAFAIGALALMLGNPPLLIVLLAAVLLLVVLARSLDTLLGWGARLVANGRGSVWVRLHALLVEAESAAASLTTSRVPILIAGTVLFWATDFAALWLIFRAFGVVLDPFRLLFLAAGLAFVHALPLPTIGGLGVAESGLAGLLMALGFEAATAISIGVSVRLSLVALHAVVIAVMFAAIAVLRSVTGSTR